MRQRISFVAGLVVVGALFGASQASAQSPQGCVGNRFQADLLKDRTFIRDGETVNYTVAVANNAAGACDASNVTLRFHLPSDAGPPSSAFTTLFTAANFPFPTAELRFGPYSFTPTFGDNPPDRYTARLSRAAGVVHDVPAPGSPLNIDRELQTLTVQPGITIDKGGSTTGGPAPQNVVYTYAVKNVTLPAGLPDDVSQMQNVVPTDDLCSPLTLISGDTNGDGKMQITETWNYTCSQTFNDPGTYTNTVKVCADEVADGFVKNYCSPPDTWTVTVTPPPPPPPVTPPTVVPDVPVVVPDSGVAPATATQAPCDIASPTGLRVRAKELTTIRVRVRNVDAGSVARITLPGGKVLRARTNASGVATFRVRPTRTGRATIRVAECADVERFTVRAARKVQTQRAPRVTG